MNKILGHVVWKAFIFHFIQIKKTANISGSRVVYFRSKGSKFSNMFSLLPMLYPFSLLSLTTPSAVSVLEPEWTGRWMWEWQQIELCSPGTASQWPLLLFILYYSRQWKGEFRRKTLSLSWPPVIWHGVPVVWTLSGVGGLVCTHIENCRIYHMPC